MESFINSFFPRSSTVPPYRKFLVCMSGKTLNVHKEFIDRLKKQINLHEVFTVDESDFILMFCPVVSRAGTDIEAAMKKLQSDSGTKHAVLVVLHHTFEKECVVPDSGRTVTRDNMIAVDCLFHEDNGLLHCSKNNESLSKTTQYVKSLESATHKNVGKQGQSVSVTHFTNKDANTHPENMNSKGDERGIAENKREQKLNLKYTHNAQNCVNLILKILFEEVVEHLYGIKNHLESNEETFSEKDAELVEKNQQLQEKDRLLTNNKETLKLNEKALEEKDNQIKQLKEEFEKSNRRYEETHTQMKDKESQLMKKLKTSKNKLIEKDRQLQVKDEALKEKEKLLTQIQTELHKTIKELENSHQDTEKKITQLENMNKLLSEKETQLKNTDKELETSNNQLETLEQELQDTKKQLEETIMVLEQQKTELAEQNKRLEGKERLLTERETQILERELQDKDKLLTENRQTLQMKDDTLEQAKKIDEEGANTSGEQHETKCDPELKCNSQEIQDHQEDENKRQKENETTELQKENAIKKEVGSTKDSHTELKNIDKEPERKGTQHEGGQQQEQSNTQEEQRFNDLNKHQKVQDLQPKDNETVQNVETNEKSSSEENAVEDGLKRMITEEQEAQTAGKKIMGSSQVSTTKQDNKREEHQAPGQPGDDLMDRDKREKDKEEKTKQLQEKEKLNNTIEVKNIQFKKGNEEEEEEDTNTDTELDQTTDQENQDARHDIERQKEVNETQETLTKVKEAKNKRVDEMCKENKEDHNVQHTEGKENESDLNEGNKEKSSSVENTKPNETTGNMKPGTESPPQLADVQTTPPETQKVEGDTKLGQDDTEKPTMKNDADEDQNTQNNSVLQQTIKEPETPEVEKESE